MTIMDTGDPTPPDFAPLQRVVRLLELERTEAARDEVTRFLAGNPQSSEGHALLSACLSMAGQGAEALSEAQQAVRLNPEGFLELYYLVAALDSLGRPKQALDAVDDLLTHHPDNATTHEVRGTLLAKLGRFEEAGDAYEESLRLDPEDADVLAALATVEMRLDRIESASELIRDALALSPDSDTAHLNRGLNLWRKGRYGEAAAAFRETLRLDPNSDIARRLLLTAMQFHDSPKRPPRPTWLRRYQAKLPLFTAVVFTVSALAPSMWIEQAPLSLLPAIALFGTFVNLATVSGISLLYARGLLNRRSRELLSDTERNSAAVAIVILAAAAASVVVAGISLSTRPPDRRRGLRDGLPTGIAGYHVFRSSSPHSFHSRGFRCRGAGNHWMRHEFGRMAWCGPADSYLLPPRGSGVRPRLLAAPATVSPKIPLTPSQSTYNNQSTVATPPRNVPASHIPTVSSPA